MVNELLQREDNTNRSPNKKQARQMQNNVRWTALSAEKLADTLNNLN